jgi:Rps23 Pro-64 3,4-dihydroxylase Tpa1-like proline 4-hydroxylase
VTDKHFHYHSGLDTLSREELLGYLCAKGLFDSAAEPLKSIQRNSVSQPFPFGQLDRVLDPVVAYHAQTEIMAIHDDAWDRYDNPFEQKWTLRDKENLPPTVKSIFDFLTSDEVVSILSEISGKALYNDPTKHYWGIHKYDVGDHLGIHVDAGLHPITKTKKQITLGIYLSQNWKEDTGCSLEMWTGDSAHLDDAKLKQRITSIAPMFNRAVWFENSDNSWHGNPTQSTKEDATRIFLTLSYLSDSQDDYQNKRTRAFFRPLPDALDSDNLQMLSLERASEQKYANVYRTNSKL